MWLYLFVIIIGVIVGYKGLLPEKIKSKSSIIQLICLLFMLFIMGAKIGMDETILKSVGSIGFQALILSFCAIVGSIFMVKLVSGFIIGNRRKCGGKEENVD